MPFVQNYKNLWVDNRGYFRDNRDWFIAYVDGSCKGDVFFSTLKSIEVSSQRKGNHQYGERFSGSGIVFGDNPRREIVQPCDPNDPSTSNHAELKAALIAIRHAHKYDLGAIQVRTDSQFLIDIIPHYEDGGNLVHHLADIVDEILDLMNGSLRVEFIHIPAHKNEPGNERADFLAKKAADIHRQYS